MKWSGLLVAAINLWFVFRMFKLIDIAKTNRRESYWK